MKAIRCEKCPMIWGWSFGQIERSRYGDRFNGKRLFAIHDQWKAACGTTGGRSLRTGEKLDARLELFQQMNRQYRNILRVDNSTRIASDEHSYRPRTRNPTSGILSGLFGHSFS